MKFPNGTTTQPRTTSAFGSRKPIKLSSGGWSSSYHYGADFTGIGDVKAIAPGVVRGAGVLSGWPAAGIQVLIDHGNNVWSRYFHLARANVSAGQSVGEGQSIGVEGATGGVTGKHLHLQIHVGGNQNAQAVEPIAYIKARLGGGSAPASGSQRTFKALTYRRAAPTTASAKVTRKGADHLKAGVVGNFVGYVHGQSVSGSDIWLKGTSGDYFHSSGLHMPNGVAGLSNLTPAPAPSSGGKQRTFKALTYRRAAPTTASAKVTRNGADHLKAGVVGNFVGYVHGQNVSGSDIWLKGTSGDYFHTSGLHMPNGVDGLPRI